MEATTSDTTPSDPLDVTPGRYGHLRRPIGESSFGDPVEVTVSAVNDVDLGDIPQRLRPTGRKDLYDDPTKREA